MCQIDKRAIFRGNKLPSSKVLAHVPRFLRLIRNTFSNQYFLGYGNFHPKTTSGRIVSMLYAFIGIPLVFTILLEWGFLYFTWIEYGWNWMNQRFCQKLVLSFINLPKHNYRSLQRRADRRFQRER